MGGLGKFLSYNNAVPIAISFMLMGAGGVFAATNPETIYSEEEKVIAIDNTYIANKDFSSWTPRVEIIGVTEDEENYYVAYRLHTIDIAEYVWQDIAKERTLTVAKSFLGDSVDLGLYTTKQLKEVADSELARLKETQQFERRAISQKTIATEYGGLVGKLLDISTETLPGYQPVVAAKPETVWKPQPEGQVAGAAVPAASQNPSSGSGEYPEPPTIQILGPNPHHIAVGVNFADLGVVVTDDSGYMPTVTTYVDGVRVTDDLVTVDTSADSEWRIEYRAVDNEGNTATAERRVIVGNGGVKDVSQPEAESVLQPGPEPTPEPVPEEPTVSEPDPAPEESQTSESEPAPEPEPAVEQESETEESVPEEVPTENAPELDTTQSTSTTE